LVVSKLRERRPSAHGTGKSDNQVRNRLRWTLAHVLSLSLASLVAGLVLLLVWGAEEEQGDLETTFGPSVEEGSPRSPETTEGFGDAQELRDRLEEIALGHEGVYGVAVLDPLSGKRVSLRGDEEFMAASIGKLPVLATLYRAGAQGELDLEEEIPILPEDIKDYGDGELLAFPVDDFLSLRESAYRMVNHSNNITWSMLDRRLGAQRIRDELKEMGIRSSRYSDDLSGYFTTPNDVLLLLEKISDPQYTSEELSEEMLNAMTETHLEDRIPERLPPNVRVAHKTGSYEENFGDAAIVFYRDSQGIERRYYLVGLSTGTDEYEARDAMQSISLAVYEALTGVKVERGWARGNAAPFESDVDDEPVLQLGLGQNTERYDEENTEPSTPSSLDEGSVPEGDRPATDEEPLSES
jgi:beta-lactamase class A